jgi:hypothetical protein
MMRYLSDWLPQLAHAAKAFIEFLLGCRPGVIDLGLGVLGLEVRGEDLVHINGT